MIFPSRNDVVNAIQNPTLLKVATLKNGSLLRGKNNRLIIYSGGFTSVFPYLINNTKKAIRCWVADPGNIADNLTKIQSYFNSTKLPYFTDFEYIKDAIVINGIHYPIMTMTWVEGETLKNFIKNNLQESTKLKLLAENFKDMCKDLHFHNISHGDLQHGNILITPNLELKLVDYDGVYVPGLENKEDSIKGLMGYQHPSRWTLDKLNPKVDYFSELVIYISIKALSVAPNLWHELKMEYTDTLIFNEEDIQHKGNTKIFGILKGLSSEMNKLVEQMIEYLYKTNIDELKPIEDIFDETSKAPWENKTQKITIHQSKVEVNPNNIATKW